MASVPAIPIRRTIRVAEGLAFYFAGNRDFNAAGVRREYRPVEFLSWNFRAAVRREMKNRAGDGRNDFAYRPRANSCLRFQYPPRDPVCWHPANCLEQKNMNLSAFLKLVIMSDACTRNKFITLQEFLSSPDTPSRGCSRGLKFLTL